MSGIQQKLPGLQRRNTQPIIIRKEKSIGTGPEMTQMIESVEKGTISFLTIFHIYIQVARGKTEQAK